MLGSLRLPRLSIFSLADTEVVTECGEPGKGKNERSVMTPLVAAAKFHGKAGGLLSWPVGVS